MTSFDKRAAGEKLASFALSPANRLFADYWLSMLTDAGHPRMSRLPAADIARARRFAVSCDVKPGRSVFVRQVGPGVAQALSNNLTNIDLIETLPANLRPIRLERTADIALGSIARNHQRIITSCGREYLVEELIVPFGDMSPQGTRQCIGHTDLTELANLPTKLDARVIRPAEKTEAIPLDFDDRTVWV